MMIKRKAPSLGVLCFVGEGVTDYLDVLVRGGWEREVSEAGAEALGNLSGWSVADLRQLRPESSVFEVLTSMGFGCEKITEDGYPMVVASDWEEAVRLAAGKNLRSMARRSVKRLDSDGVERVSVSREASPEELEAAARRFVALHRDYWREKDISPEHLKERFEELLVALCGRLVPNGTVEVREFLRDGEVIASQIVMVRDGYAGQFLSGARPEIAKRYQLSSLFVYDGFDVAARVGASGFDFLRGEESYKLRWNPEVKPGLRAICGRNRPALAGYLALVRLHTTLRAYAHSEDAPEPVRRLYSTFTAARTKRARSDHPDR